MHKINVRIEDNTKNTLDKIFEENKNVSKASIMRECMEIGVKHFNSKNAVGWDLLYQKGLKNTLESKTIMKAIYRNMFDPKNSRYESADAEFDGIKSIVQNYIDENSGDNNE